MVLKGVISAKLPDHSRLQFNLSLLGARWWKRGGIWRQKWERLKAGESNGNVPLRTCLECSVPEPYRSPDWVLVPAKPAQRLNTSNNTLLAASAVLARFDSNFLLLLCQGAWNKTCTQLSVSQILSYDPQNYGLGNVQRFFYDCWCDLTVIFDQISNSSNVYLSSSRFWTATSLVIFYQHHYVS
jgi:hypothetical protein